MGQKNCESGPFGPFWASDLLSNTPVSTYPTPYLIPLPQHPISPPPTSTLISPSHLIPHPLPKFIPLRTPKFFLGPTGNLRVHFCRLTTLKFNLEGIVIPLWDITIATQLGRRKPIIRLISGPSKAFEVKKGNKVVNGAKKHESGPFGPLYTSDLAP